MTLPEKKDCIFKVNLSNKNLILTFINGNKANDTDYVDMNFITVNILKSILPWTAPNISILLNLHLQLSNLRRSRKLHILLSNFITE